jgi:hypothetical protein
MPIRIALANNTPEATLQLRPAIDPDDQLHRCARRGRGANGCHLPDSYRSIHLMLPLTQVAVMSRSVRALSATLALAVAP